MVMCHYIQKVHDKEILKMTAEFVADDNDTIWLVHAKDIIISHKITLNNLVSKMMFAKNREEGEKDTPEMLEKRLYVPEFTVSTLEYSIRLGKY